jgi:hypothetical protein
MDKRAALLEYKLSHRPMGVFQIRNTATGKLFIDSSTNIPGKINRHKFALNAGLHASKTLQADWNELGESAFEFETIEPVEPRDDPNYDYRSDLETLEGLWLEKLGPNEPQGYNVRKLTREERLQMIAAKREI